MSAQSNQNQIVYFIWQSILYEHCELYKICHTLTAKLQRIMSTAVHLVVPTTSQKFYNIYNGCQFTTELFSKSPPWFTSVPMGRHQLIWHHSVFLSHW